MKTSMIIGARHIPQRGTLTMTEDLPPRVYDHALRRGVAAR